MAKKEKITIYDYVASVSPAEAHFLINKFGSYRKARDERELAYQLKTFVREFGENGLRELAKIHPDRELIEIECRECEIKDKEKSNFVQPTLTHSPLPHYSNMSGEDKGSESKIDGKLIVLGAFVIMAVALIMEKNKNK
jgi:hypothetical protein